METGEFTRGCGILLSISSLPSPYGIGTMGEAAFRFIDLLTDLKQKYWQVLPIGPTSYGDSPYQPLSSCAGNIYFIDLDKLVADGLLSTDEIRCFNWGSDDTEIDYAVLFTNRKKILQKAFERFDINAQEFCDFKKENSSWLGDYSLFMALKNDNSNKNWTEWPQEFKTRQPVALANYQKTHYNEISFWEFCQYEFFKQWAEMKQYADSRGIQIIGDVSFFVGLDSVDVWAEPSQFLIDANGKPSVVAAAVPDKFSEAGQIWGNPMYDWKQMETDGFEWWRQRIRIRKKQFDIIRIDHFIGMVKDYTVLSEAESALSGKWVKGPGKKLADALKTELGDIRIIADDYTGAALLPGVKKLLSKTGWMGTKVLMFAFDGNTANEHLPHNYVNSQVAVYCGTHDNETIVGTFRDKTEYELAYLYQYLNISCKEEIPDALIRAAYASTADLAIIQMQDILKLGNEARMNEPSTVGGNWRWRLGQEELDESRIAWIRNLAAVYRR